MTSMRRNLQNSLIVGLLLLLLLGCSKNDLLPGQRIVGTWRLYETGYSPGAGYYVDKIPKRPLQYITLSNDGRLSSEGKNLRGIFEAHYYRVDSTQYGLKIIFMEKKTDTTGFVNSLQIEGNTMRISPACIEGCHMAFVRIY